MTTRTIWIMIVALLAGCSSSNDKGEDTIEDISTNNFSRQEALQLENIPERIGLISFSDRLAFGEITTLIGFMNWPASGGTDVSPLFGQNATFFDDSCLVSENGIDRDLIPYDILSKDFDFISAGESITLTSESGTYGSMELFEIRDMEFSYFSSTDLLFPSPSVLTFSIPGDDFGATTVSSVKPELIEGFSMPLETAVQKSETLSWIESTQNGSVISVTLYDQGLRYAAKCIVTDDGEFVLPASLFTDALAISGEPPAMFLADVTRTTLTVTADELTKDVIIHTRSVNLNE